MTHLYREEAQWNHGHSEAEMRIMAARKAAYHYSKLSKAPRSSLSQFRDGIRHGWHRSERG